MKKNRILSSLLCLSLAAGLVIPGLPAYAEGEGESGSNSGMKISKTAVANKNGTYTITLEAYATGQKVISQVNKDVPTDIVLVLDQSGSMDKPIGTVSFEPYKDIYWYGTTYYYTRNQDHYENRHNGGNANLWHKLDENSYVSVSVTLEQDISYKEITNGKNNSTRNNATNYWDNRNNLYALVNGEYKKVTVTYEYDFSIWDYNYVYTLPDETVIARSSGDRESPTFTGIDGKNLYLASADATQNVYTYTYVDADGNTQTIGTSTGADTRFGTTLYQRNINTNAGDSKIEALTTAVTTFTNNVATKAAGADGKLGTDDDINHRLALVGFASGNNTELLSIAGSNSGSVGVAYGDGNISDQNLKAVLQNMNTQSGQDMVTAAINALAANGATRVDHGMDMAQKILEANPVPAGEKRNRVVVVFTDGSPTSSNGFEKSVATSAISKADAIKAGGATVYSVGIFPGADPTSPGTEPSGNLGNNSSSIPAASNWFMQNLSSNNGTVNIPGCYLSASDSTTLNSIFEKLADNIESGGTTTTLNESAVIKDIISPQFTLPAGATPSDITLETYEYKGPAYDAANAWTKNATAMGAVATVDGDKVNVTGFNFSENWCGTEKNSGTTTYRGNKLVISFTVSPKAGFLGGNDVYTNTSAGVYESANAQNPVLTFDRPQVNVPIKAVTVTPQDKNVYLLNGVTLDELKTGATVTVGDVPLDLSAENFGLQAWQNEYVNITVKITDANGTEVTTPLSQLKDDTTYTITVTVTPKSNGEGASGTVATEKSGNDNADINVYKPELTYQDSKVFYGDDVPTDAELADNLSLTQWKHNGTEATADMGTAPDLAITYTPNASQIDDNNKINSTQDIPVAAVVKIGNEDVTTYTTFVHTPCEPACGWNETVTPNGNPAFLLHVKTASLIINKTGAEGNKNEGFIFDVTGPNNLTFRVSVKDNGTVKITGLPLGTYTVEEDTNWSWRYKAQNQGSAELTKDKPEGTVTIKNAKDNYYLLDGNAYKQNNSVQYAAN